MSLMLQAKLLRVLQEREFERVGGVKQHQAARARHRRHPPQPRRGGGARALPRGPLPAPQGHHPADPPAARAPRGHPLAGAAPARAHQREGAQARHPRAPRGARPPHPPALARQRARAGERAHPRRGARPGRGAAAATTCPRWSPARPAAAGRTRPPPPAAPCFAAPAVDDASLIPTLDEAERMLIERAMAVTKGHKGKTCQILGISRPTLERKLQKYAGVQASAGRS